MEYLVRFDFVRRRLRASVCISKIKLIEKVLEKVNPYRPSLPRRRQKLDFPADDTLHGPTPPAKQAPAFLGVAASGGEGGVVEELGGRVVGEAEGPAPWLPDGYSRIFKIICVWPFGLQDYGSAMLR